MSGWRMRLAAVASRIELPIDAARRRFWRRLGLQDPIQIVIYRGYGTPDALRLRGRVVARRASAARRGATRPGATCAGCTALRRRGNPGATVRVHFAGDHGPPIAGRHRRGGLLPRRARAARQGRGLARGDGRPRRAAAARPAGRARGAGRYSSRRPTRPSA